MIKYIVRDYFEAFRLTNLRQRQGTACSKIVLLPAMGIASIAINLFAGQLEKSASVWTDTVQFLAVLLPLCFSYFSMAVHPVQLSKMMYLCPMNAKERSNYIYGSYFFRIAIQMSIGFLGLWIAAGSVSWDFFTAVWILTNQLMTASLVNGGAHNGSRMPAVGELIFLFSLIASILQMDCMRGDVSDERILNIGMLIFFCVVQVPLECIYINYIRKSLQSAVFYENSRTSWRSE